MVHSRTQPQHQDSDAELSGKSTKKKAADKKPTVEGSRLREEGRSTSFKLANQRVKSEEDSQRKSSNSKVNISKTSSCAGAKKRTRMKLKIIPNTNVTKSVRLTTNLPEGG